MKKYVLFLLMLVFTLVSSAKANDVYVAQVPAGLANGSISCSNAQSLSSFTGWVPGLVLHLCGLFTGTPGQQLLAVRASGTATSPITVRLDGAVLSAPYWSSNGAINAQNQNFIIIDGGGTGIIQNTDSGTGKTYHNDTRALHLGNCTNCSVRNLIVQNLYVHTSLDDVSVRQTAVNCVFWIGANNLTIHNLTCHDVGWGLAGTGNGLTVEYSNFYNIDHGIAFGASGTTSGFSIHDNHFHDYANWNNTVNAYHHDGIHLWGQNGGTITNGQIYNNLFDGDCGQNITAHVYIQDSVKDVSVFNNIFIVPPTRTINALWILAQSSTDATKMPGGFATNNSVYNNYINAGGHTRGSALTANGQFNLTVVNNSLIGGNTNISFTGGTTLLNVDNNVYEDLAADKVSLNPFGWQGTVVKSLSAWRTACNCDWSSKLTPVSNIILGKLPIGSVSVVPN